MHPERRPAKIVQVGQRRALDLAIEVPSDELSSVMTTKMWEEAFDKLAACTQTHRSTLVFVNTRRLVERIAFALAERLGQENVAAHHGSLSRTMPGCNSPEQNALIRQARMHMSVYEDMAELIRLGAYRRGTDPAVDEAIRLYPAIEAFLGQERGERSNLETGYAQLAEILGQPYTPAQPAASSEANA